MNALSAAAAAEIVALHAAFVELFTHRSRDFSRCAAAFAPDFAMVTPEGRVIDRAAILAGLEAARAAPDFRIDISEIRVIQEGDTSSLLQYVEEQYRDGRTTRCRSTVLFEADAKAPLGVVWRYLHETWLRDAG